MSDLKQVWARAIQKGWDSGWISGRLGRLNSDGSYTLQVSGRTGWVHVRLGVNGDLGNTIARNDGAPLHRDLPIRMRRENNILVVHGIDEHSGFTPGGGVGSLPPHASSHNRLGPDPLFITGPAFLPLMARPTNPPSMAVTVMQGFYRYEGEVEVWETANSSNLSAYIPSSGVQHFVVISLNRATNALAITDGNDVASTASAAPFSAAQVEAVVDTLTSAHYPIAAIRFYNGQTAIRNADIFIDLRPWGGDSIGAGGADFDAIMTDANGDIMVDANGNVMIES